MRLGMNLLLWTAKFEPEQFSLLQRLKAIGFDGVELPFFDHTDDELRQIRRQLEDLGLGATAVTVCDAAANPIDPDPVVRSAALDYLRRRIDWCAISGAEVLCGPFHSALGQLAGRGRTTDEWLWCVEVLRAAAEHAGSAGVKLSVEPLNRFEVYFLNTAADANALCAEVDHPALGYLFDTFHSNIEENSIAGALLANSRHINHIHVSENHRGVPGSGHVEWSEFFPAVAQSGYDGWLVIEAFGRALPELAAATCIWRDLFDAEWDVAEQGIDCIRRGLAAC